jgi:transcriptional regulator with XRE-family HTH domain
MADVVNLESRRRGAWRRAVGGVLREWRTAQGLRLADVAAAAGVSTQYLSEVERGRKEPSSEVLGAVTEALGSSLTALALGVADGLREAPRRVELESVDVPLGAPPSRELESVDAPGKTVVGRGAWGSVTLLAA